MTTTIAIIATTRCQHCGKRFRIDPNPAFLPCPPSEYEGRLKRCPVCHKLFTVKLDDGHQAQEAMIDWLNSGTNPNWVDDVYAGTNRRSKAQPDAREPISLPATIPARRLAEMLQDNQIDDVYGNLPSIDERVFNDRLNTERATRTVGSFIAAGFVAFILAAILFSLLLPIDIAAPATLIVGLAIAIWVARYEKLLGPARVIKRLRDEQLRKWIRQRKRAANYDPTLSFKTYMAESGQGIDTLQKAVGLPPLVTGALKMASYAGQILFSPIDYPMWRAVKQGKMNEWDRVAVNLGIIYLLHRWHKASRKRQDMKDQAELIAQAMKRNGL